MTNQKLESESSSQTQELSRLVIELQQKDSDLERVRQESSSKSQEMSRLVNELLQKDAEVDKTRNEVDALRSDNAVSCAFSGAGRYTSEPRLCQSCTVAFGLRQ